MKRYFALGITLMGAVSLALAGYDVGGGLTGSGGTVSGESNFVNPTNASDNTSIAGGEVRTITLDATNITASTATITNITAVQGITLGGVYRQTWPSGGGGASDPFAATNISLIGSTGALYLFGDEATVGSWRIKYVSGNIEMQVRQAGGWTNSARFVEP